MPYVQKSFTFNGKRYYVKGKDEEDAKRKLEEKRKAVESNSLTYEEWFKRYIKAYKSNILKTTQKTYISEYNTFFAGIRGKMLNEITPMDCQQIANLTAGYSQSTIINVKGLLEDSFDKAIDNGYASVNPCLKLSFPKGYKHTHRALTKKERRLLELIFEKSGTPYLYCKIMYYCGLRPSEVARIRGKDIKGDNLYVRGTKTENAPRTVPIPKKLEFPFLSDDELLFPDKNGKEDYKAYQKYWKLINKQLKSDTTIYSLRHDYCTRLQEAGVPIDVARRLMGHASIQTTSRIYTHANEKAYEDARKLINSYVEDENKK